MYRFQIRAHTQPGEAIGLIGAAPELGQWDIYRCLRLETHPDSYPLWWVDVEIAPSEHPIEYKYVYFRKDGYAEWEAWGNNRWLPSPSDRPTGRIIVEDLSFGQVPPWPYGYYETPPQASLPVGHDGRFPFREASPTGLKIVVLGSSVAMGCSAWLLDGWANRLGTVLGEKYGHTLVNRSALGSTVNSTLDRFEAVVRPEQPDIVILALSLGNEGFAFCPPHQRRTIQRRFESGLQQLIRRTREMGAYPMLGGLYPHGDYRSDHAALLLDTQSRMLSWGVPVLNWWSEIADAQGRWQPNTAFDPAHPNTEGHRRMFEAIDLESFNLTRAQIHEAVQKPLLVERVLYEDDQGFRVAIAPSPDRIHEAQLHMVNPSVHPYNLTAQWQSLQTAVQQAQLLSGLYIAAQAPEGMRSDLWIDESGTIATDQTIVPGADLYYRAAQQVIISSLQPPLFQDGALTLLPEGDRSLRVINESDHNYNIQPMWPEVRRALQALPEGVYCDRHQPEVPFRTLMIGREGLESRVKAPAQSSFLLQYDCPLSAINRVAILPLGDRCAVRMLLYKLEFDGPAFPFDLTRTTNLADVADIIATGFEDMWNPEFLHYNAVEKRIYHSKWSGLSFAHEVEDTDNPDYSMQPVHERMRKRYSARAQRFIYSMTHSDKILFVRTGAVDRGTVIDLMEKLEVKCAGKPFRLLILSPQSSEEFAGLDRVVHYDRYFNPDRMYADLAYWMECAKEMGEILATLSVSSQNLFWCPPNLARS